MDDFEDPKVRRARGLPPQTYEDDIKQPTLAEERAARGRCPQCGGPKYSFQVFCGVACCAKAEAHEPPQPETEEESSS